jgi:arsenate reductase
MDITIYHKPACGTKRNTPTLIRAAGIEPTVIDYPTTTPGRDTIRALARATDEPLRWTFFPR